MAKISQEKWWSQGLALALELSAWLVVPLIAALFGGKWLDNRYGTAPWLFLACAGAAFFITCGGIIYKTILWMREIKKEEQDKKPTDLHTND